MRARWAPLALPLGSLPLLAAGRPVDAGAAFLIAIAILPLLGALGSAASFGALSWTIAAAWLGVALDLRDAVGVALALAALGLAQREGRAAPWTALALAAVATFAPAVAIAWIAAWPWLLPRTRGLILSWSAAALAALVILPISAGSWASATADVLRALLASALGVAGWSFAVRLRERALTLGAVRPAAMLIGLMPMAALLALLLTTRDVVATDAAWTALKSGAVALAAALVGAFAILGVALILASRNPWKGLGVGAIGVVAAAPWPAPIPVLLLLACVAASIGAASAWGDVRERRSGGFGAWGQRRPKRG